MRGTFKELLVEIAFRGYRHGLSDALTSSSQAESDLRVNEFGNIESTSEEEKRKRN